MSATPWKLKAHALCAALEGLSDVNKELIQRCDRDANDANVPDELSDSPDRRLRHPLSAQPLELGTAFEPNAPPRPAELDATELDDQAYRRLWLRWMRDPSMRRAASARLPDHSRGAHRSLTAALVGARQDGDQAALLYLHVGPVQSFVAAARRTHDLFVGSFSIAYLTFLGVKAVVEAVGPDAIVYPALAEMPLARATLFGERPSTNEEAPFSRSSLLRSSLPNKVLAIVPKERAKEIAASAATAVRSGWEEIAEAVRGRLRDHAARAAQMAGGGAWDAGWDEQIRDQLEVDVVVQPWPRRRVEVRALLEHAGTPAELAPSWSDDEGPAGAAFGMLYDLTHRVMSGHRSTLAGKPKAGDCRPKCSLCGAREQMGPIADWPAAQQRMTRSFFQELGVAHQHRGGSGAAGRSLQIDRSDGLCAVCLTKRFALESYFGADRLPFDIASHKAGTEDGFLLRFPSISTIASAPFRSEALRSKDASGALRTLAGHIEGLPLDFTPPGNLLPGFGDLGRADPALSLEGEWLYDFAYEPLTAWRSHRATPWREDGPDCKALKSALPERRRELASIYASIHPRRTVRPSAYYAVLVLDGDKMGEWLTGRHPETPRLGEINEALPADVRERRRPLFPALHGELSGRLGALSASLYEVVERRFLGRIVYSGGDDLLALLPLQTALPCLRAVRETIRSLTHLGDRVTVSAGLAIAHVRTPLRTALRLAHGAERAAKGPRNSFAVSVDKRSGAALDLVLPFEATKADGGVVDVLLALQDLLRWSDTGENESARSGARRPKSPDATSIDEEDGHPLLRVNVAHRLREEADTLAALGMDAFRFRLNRLLPKRHLGHRASELLHETTLPGLPEEARAKTEERTVRALADLLFFVRFLLREEHGIVTADLLGDLEKLAKEKRS